MAPVKQSKVYRYFDRNYTGGRCKLCYVDIKSKGNTTNFNIQLIRKHPKVLKAHVPDSNPLPSCSSASTDSNMVSTDTEYLPEQMQFQTLSECQKYI